MALGLGWHALRVLLYIIIIIHKETLNSIYPRLVKASWYRIKHATETLYLCIQIRN